MYRELAFSLMVAFQKQGGSEPNKPDLLLAWLLRILNLLALVMLSQARKLLPGAVPSSWWRIEDEVFAILDQPNPPRQAIRC